MACGTYTKTKGLTLLSAAIYTAAMEMLGGGDQIGKQCRKPEIMSDAAYMMLCKDSRSYTGHFAVDDEVLKEGGVTDLEKYSCVPGKYIILLIHGKKNRYSEIRQIHRHIT